jgi:hypothetical protein
MASLGRKKKLGKISLNELKKRFSFPKYVLKTQKQLDFHQHIIQ